MLLTKTSPCYKVKHPDVSGGRYKVLSSEIRLFTHKINASYRIPKQIGQYKTENGGKNPSTDDRVVIVCPKPLVPETSKGMKLACNCYIKEGVAAICIGGGNG